MQATGPIQDEAHRLIVVERHQWRVAWWSLVALAVVALLAALAAWG